TPFDSNSLSFVGGTPLFARFFLGGETDIRGYNVRGISPVATVNTLVSTQNVVAKTLTGQTLRIKEPDHATGNSVAPSTLAKFTFTNQPGDPTLFQQFPAFVGGDSELLFNAEYRIPIFGPLAFAPFFDIGSVFDLRSLPDQLQVGEFVANQTLTSVTLNPRGEIATQREIRQARPPESSGALPPGFQVVN